MNEAFTHPSGMKAKFPAGGEKMTSVRGSAGSPAKASFAIDPAKRYFIHAAGATSVVSPPSVGGKLWYYDGQGKITEVCSNWASTNDFACVLGAGEIIVTNTLSSYSSGSNLVLVTLIPLE